MDMNLCIVFWLCVYFASVLATYQGFWRQSECFDVVNVPSDECNTPLSRAFTPKSPNYSHFELTTALYLFTPEEPNRAEPLHECGGELPPNTNYDVSVPTEIIIHGFFDGVCRTVWMREMKEQLFQRGRYNVILVDWSWGNIPDYYVSFTNTRIVGEQVGFTINNIMRQTGVSPDTFHVIGHSLGATASIYIGKTVKNLGRITGLDPAIAPLADAPPSERLTWRSAEIVDIIHTNSYHCFVIGVSDGRPTGHADFYPNGGLFQPGCYLNVILLSLLKPDPLMAIAGLVPQLCSHYMAVQYYKASINSKGCQLVGVASDSYASFKTKTEISDEDWAVMGMDYPLYHKGHRERKYYLDTNIHCPFYEDSYLKGKKFPFNTSCFA